MLVSNTQLIDLGELKYGVPKSFTYTIENISNEDIFIKSIVVGCNACTTAVMKANTIKPNGSETLEVVFTPGSTGVNNKTVTIHYKTFTLPLKFKAIVQP